MIKILRFAVIMTICLLYPLQTENALGDQYGHDGNLIIWIEANKTKYELGEPIIINFTMSNFTTVPLIVNKRFHPSGDFKWDLFYDGFGMVTTNFMPFEALKNEDFVQLEVNDEINRLLPDLQEIFSTPFKEGRYALRLTYTNASEPPEKEKSPQGETWAGTIVTNLLWIEIKTPEKI